MLSAKEEPLQPQQWHKTKKVTIFFLHKTNFFLSLGFLLTTYYQIRYP